MTNDLLTAAVLQEATGRARAALQKVAYRDPAVRMVQWWWPRLHMHIHLS